MHRLVVPLVVVGVVLSCSSETAPEEDAGTGPATAPQRTAVPEGAATSAAFEIPPELLERVEARGFDVIDVDYPEQPDGVPWPTGAWPTGPLPDGVDRAEVDALVQGAFTGGTGDTDVIDAVLVVKDGRLVVEAYNGWDPEARHNSWSMAKSITAAQVGILEGQGEIDVFEAATAPEWADPEDPRHGITIDDLLRMSSGLRWEEDYADINGDVLTIIAGDGQADRAGYTAAKPLDDGVDTVWEYSTGTADVIAREVAERVGFGDELVGWIQGNLFDPLGIPGADHQVDRAGVANGGSWINLRPVDFARFGYLFLRGGEWDGEQILPEEWVDYSRLPTPTADEEVYGAQWWLMEGRPGVFWASGFNGQSITVVPQEDLVIVVLSATTTGRPDQLQADLLDLLAGPAPGRAGS